MKICTILDMFLCANTFASFINTHFGHLFSKSQMYLILFHVFVCKLSLCTQVVQILLKHGANPRIINKNGKTPLDLASSSEIRGLMLGAIIKPVSEVSKTEPLKGAAPLPHSVDLDERPTTEEKKKEPATETEAATEAIKETTSAPSSEGTDWLLFHFTPENTDAFSNICHSSETVKEL